ncbi:unnamed protein product [Choristocarpus tenellus]
MVIICVDPGDTVLCAKALSLAIKGGDDFACISLQRGVRNFAGMKSQLHDHSIVLDGAVGLSIFRSPLDGSLSCLDSGCLVLQRLTKEQAKEGLKFVNLLCSSGIRVRHCKNITCFTHGALIFQTVEATAALTGLSLDKHLMDHHSRLVWAAMIREGLKVLTAASRGGSWHASNACCSLTLRQLELFLCLPSWVFGALSYLLLGIPAHTPRHMCAAMQVDLAEGRATAVDWTLGEMVRLARRNNVQTPACSAVLAAVKEAMENGDGVPSFKPEVLYEITGQSSESVLALYRKLVAWMSSLTLVFVVVNVIAGIVPALILLTVTCLVAAIKYIIIADTVP